MDTSLLASSLVRRALLCAATALAPALQAAPLEGNLPLRNTAWTVQTLNGSPVIPGARPLQITLRSTPQHLSGFAGCNTLKGRYTQRGTTIALKPLATTRMACAPALMDQERRLLQALGEADGYRIEGAQLSLLQADGVTVTLRAHPAR